MTLKAAHRKNRASTHAGHSDPALRGRTYAIPFDGVWNAAVELTSGGLRRWSLLDADDGPGTLQAEAGPFLFGRPSEVLIRVSLDRNGQTRVDAVASTGGPRWDWGACRRRAIHFFRALDRALASRGRPVPAPPEEPASSR